jgi:hypothetical protein
MKRFKEYISEKYMSSYENRMGTIEIFKNPTQRELNDLYKEDNFSNDARGYIDDKGNLFAWSTNEFHDPAISHLNKIKQISMFKNGIEVYITKPNEVYPAKSTYLSKSIKDDTKKLFDKASKLNKGFKFIMKPFVGK